MRIRRRPQGQSLSSLLPSDPPAPQQPPPHSNASPRAHHLELPAAADKREELHPNADLRDASSSSAARRAVALLPLLPQDNVVECSRGLGAAADDGHGSLENGHHHYHEMPVDEEAVIKVVGERLANGLIGPATTVVTATVHKKEEAVIQNESSGGGGMKKRRGPAVLLEGSRCSRVNGRGWRCSQPTLVGYSLCEHHLGKGRMRSAAAAAGRAAAGQQLGRTEHRKSSVAVSPATPKADVSPSMSHC